MKVLTLHQPWASLVSLGVKTIETRSWRAPSLIRVDVAVHASVRRPSPHVHRDVNADLPPSIDLIAMSQCWEWTEHPDNPQHGGVYRWVGPLGAIVATATVAECLPITDDCSNTRAHLCISRFDPTHLLAHSPLERPWPDGETEHDVSDQQPYGDFTPGRWAWLLTDVEPLDAPVPFRGGQGLSREWTP